MSRLFLAFVCFFRILFGKKLPQAAVAYLPEGAEPKALAEDQPARPIEKPAPKAFLQPVA